MCDICSLGLSSKQGLIKHIQRHQENQEKRSKTFRKSNVERKKRKDAGVPKKSVLSQLIGLKLPNDLEKLVMARTEAVTVSNEENDKNSSNIEINLLS